MNNYNKNQQRRKALTRLIAGFFMLCCLALLAGMSGCTGAKMNLSSGCGEVGNKNKHCRDELNVSVPIMEIIIPISPSKPNNPIFIVEGLGRSVQTVTDGTNDVRFNVREHFAGLGLVSDAMRAGVLLNERDYVVTAEGYHQLTNILRLRAGGEHRNTWQDLQPEERIKSTELHVGLDRRLSKRLSTGLSYHSGNLSAEKHQDRSMVNLEYRF